MAYSQNEALLLSNIDNLHSQLLEQQERVAELQGRLAHRERIEEAYLQGISDYLEGKSLADSPYISADEKEVWELGFQQEATNSTQRAELATCKARYEHLKTHATPLRSGPFWEGDKATYTLHWEISLSTLPLPADTFDEAVDLAIEGGKE